MAIELNINIEFTTGKHPILGALAFWMLPKKKITEVITQGIEQNLAASYLQDTLAYRKAETCHEN